MMRTEGDSRPPISGLAESAPSPSLLNLQFRAGMPGRRTAVPPTLITAATVLAVVCGLLVILQHYTATPPHPTGSSDHGAAAEPDGSARAYPPIDYPTEYWFGPSSLPGYRLTSLSISPGYQSMNYQPDGRKGAVAANVFVNGFAPDARTIAALEELPPVLIGSHRAYYGSLSPVASTLELEPTAVGLVWRLGTDRWVAMTATSHTGSQAAVTRSALIGLARTLRPTMDDHVALVKVGYLPSQLRFDYAADYLDQGLMDSPDGSTGTGYRTLSFIDRSVADDRHSTLDIDSVIDPNTPLIEATKKTLPGFDNGPWTKTTIRGHLAYVAPHDVLIQWGPIQVGLASTQITGDETTPLLSEKTLLKVANSLTVSTSNAVGVGYPLATAIPASSRR